MWWRGVKVFPQIFKIGMSKQNDTVELSKFVEWGTNLFFAVIVILRSLIYLIIWFICIMFLEFHILVCLYYVPCASIFRLLLEKAFCFAFLLAI